MRPFVRRSSVRLPLLTLALAVGYSPHPAARSAAPVVWTASSLERVGEHDAPRGLTPAAIAAARGEYESFQVVVRPSPGATLTNVRVTMTDLAGPGGAVISNTAFALYREHYVTVSKGSPDPWGSNRPLGAGRYADALIPFVDPETGQPPVPAALRAQPFSVAADTNQPIWIDVLVPRNAAPGDYTGSVSVSSDQGLASGAISLHVWNFTLPLTPSLKSSFPFGNGASGTPAQNRELLRHRLSPVSTPPADERSLMDTYGLSGRALGFWSNANHADCASMDPPPSVAEILASKARHQPELFLYNYTADEIGSCTWLFPALRAWAVNLHAAGVPNLVTMAPTPALFDDGTGTGRSVVDIWTVLPWVYDDHLADVATALRKGDRVWSYNALVQDDYSPKWQMDYPPIDFRLHPGFLSQRLGLTGLLAWKVDRWTADPWNDVNNTGVFAPGNNYPGEGMLVYPGAQAGLVGVAPSMRLKWLRDGVDDYDYLDLLRNQSRPLADAYAGRIATDWRTWTRDPAEVDAARREIGEELSRRATPSDALTAGVIGAAVRFSWGIAPGATAMGTTLVASLSAGGAPIAQLPLGGGTSLDIPAVPPGTYYVRLATRRADGTTTYSNEVEVTVGDPRPGPPTMHAASVAGRQVTMSWTPGTGLKPASYVLVAAVSTSGPVVATVPVVGTSFTVDAPPGQYFVAVLPVSAAGTGPASNVVAITVR